MCGEECLDVCRVCDPEKFEEMKEIFFGTEDDEDARFIQLADCKHVFEATVSSYFNVFLILYLQF